MQELISERTANQIVNILAIVGPVIGLAVGAVAGRLRKTGRADVIKGLAIGSLGVLNLVLWRVYNTVTNVFGISSVTNLLAQLGMFVVIGIAAGLLYTTFFVRTKHT